MNRCISSRPSLFEICMLLLFTVTDKIEKKFASLSICTISFSYVCTSIHMICRIRPLLLYFLFYHRLNIFLSPSDYFSFCLNVSIYSFYYITLPFKKSLPFKSSVVGWRPTLIRGGSLTLTVKV
jgi:hypothetical protein